MSWIIRQRPFANHVWPIRCGAWVASKSRVVVRSESNPRSTTTPARLDPSCTSTTAVVHPVHVDVSTPVHQGFIILQVINQLPGPLRDSTDSLATLSTTRLSPLSLSPSQYNSATWWTIRNRCPSVLVANASLRADSSSSPTPTKKLPTHPPRPSILSLPSRALPFNTQTSQRPVRHNPVLLIPTISSRSTSHVIIPQIAPFLPHRPLQAPPPSSRPPHQVHPVKRAFLQLTSLRAATAIILRTPLSRALTKLSRKSPLHSATFDGNPVVTTCHRQLEACAPFVSIFLRDPPDFCVFSPPSITITLLKLGNPIHA